MAALRRCGARHRHAPREKDCKGFLIHRLANRGRDAPGRRMVAAALLPRSITLSGDAFGEAQPYVRYS
jgi:hypothetical protein